MLSEDEISRYSVSKGVKWHFQPPCASHMGGVWERPIRTVRKVLSGILKSQIRLTDEGLSTVFCEVESITNSRPLTKVSDDISDGTAITPNHLLLLRDCPTLAPGIFHESDVYKRMWRCVQHIANEFWKKWLRHYLPELQCRRKWTHKTRNVVVGDLVLVAHENTPRGVWPMGIVQSVQTSTDGLVRSARIRTKSSTMDRPITKLVLLECSP